MAKNRPTINQLFFADNSIIFCGASIGELNEVQNILEIYEVASGQGINKYKTRIFFSNTHPTIRVDILNIIGVSLCTNQERYLGLPTMVGKNRFRTFASIRDRVWARVSNWNNVFFIPSGQRGIVEIYYPNYSYLYYEPFPFLKKDLQRHCVCHGQVLVESYEHMNKDTSIH